MEKQTEMKIIFLDIDGVLNCAEWAQKEYDKGNIHALQENFDTAAIVHLNTIIEQSGAKVVISSSWRLMYSLAHIETLLIKHGFKGVILGITPPRQSLTSRRGNEIQAWLASVPQVTKFVILDDDSDMLHLLPFLVQTNWETGLQEYHIDRALNLLK